MPALSPRASTVAAALVATAAVAGCGGSSGGGSSSPKAKSSAAPAAPAAAASAPVQSAAVDIRSFKYKPVTVAVRKGGRVRWKNSDTAAHTATADDRSFDTQTIDRRKVGMVTFTRTGTFAYHCDFHPFMKATVVVK